MIDTPTPALIISLVGMLHGAATIALGGVPTGKEKACEQAKQAGNIKYIGCHFAAMHISAKTGRITLATATLLVKSVMKDAHTHAITCRTTTNTLITSYYFIKIISLP